MAATHKQKGNSQPKGTGGLIDEAFMFYGRNAFAVVAIAVVPGVAYAGFGYLMSETMFGFQITSIIKNLPKIVAGVALLIPLFALMNGMLAHAILESRLGNKASLVRSLRFVRPRLWHLIGARLISGFILLVVAAVSVGLFYLLAALGKTPLLGMIFAFIVACVWIYLYVTWLFVEHVVLFENCSSRAALRRSEAWAGGRRWGLIWTMLVFHLIVMLLSLTPSPFSLLAGLQIAQTLALPLYPIAAALLYLDTGLRRGGFRASDLQPLVEGSP